MVAKVIEKDNYLGELGPIPGNMKDSIHLEVTNL